MSVVALACDDTVEIDVQVVDPCNQSAVSSMELLTFSPRGTGLDSAGLETTLDVSSGRGEPLDIPLVPDFQLVVQGFQSITDFDAQRVSGLGLSSVVDLTEETDRVSINVPFALVDRFHRTTQVSSPGTCTELSVDRFGHSATYLPASDRVLIVGGGRLVPIDGGLTRLEYPRSIELFDPETGTFSVVGELQVGGARAFHTATLLADGRVLVAGGEAEISGRREALRSAFVIDVSDPENATVANAALSMLSPRTGHRAVRLNDGRVVILGGRILTEGASGPQDYEYLSSIEVYEPAAGLFLRLNDPQSNALAMSAARFGHSATLMPNGQEIFVAGGMDASGPILGPEIIRMVSGDVFTVEAPSGLAIGVGAIFHAAALDPSSGGVVLSGGYARAIDAEPAGGLPANPSASVETWVWNDNDGAVERVCTASLNEERGLHTLSIVSNRAVFVGGRGWTGLPIAASEWATLNATFAGGDCFASAPVPQTMTDARARHAAVSIARSGDVLIIGGRQQESGDTFGRTTATAEVFSPGRQP